MSWTELPVGIGDVVEKAQLGELRAAIIERRRAVGMSVSGGLGDPPEVSVGEVAAAATVDAYRSRVQELIGRFVKPQFPGQNWTKTSVLQAAIGKPEWTNVPARGGSPSDGASLPAGTVMYVEHLNEMKAVLDRLYIVRIEEKEGREYCANGGSGWVWSDTGWDPLITARTGGNHQLNQRTERGESGPYDFELEPLGTVTVTAVKAKGLLWGTDEDLTAKFVNFALGDATDIQPTDRDWYAQLRISEARPADSPRGDDTTTFYTNNLADDDSHKADSKNNSPNTLEVYIDDEWGPETVPAGDAAEWPFWITTILADYAPIEAAYVQEAIDTGRELQVWFGSVYFPVQHVWAELDFEYLDK